MVTNMQNRWAVAGSTFLLWALVAGSAVFWGMKMSARPGAAPVAPVLQRPPAAADPVALARLLGAAPATAGAAPAAPSLASRLVLVGVVASTSQHGAALISMDGKPAKPYRVGAAIEEGLVLQSVQGRRAVLAANATGPAVLTLELPPRK
ncbi:type II secretion system protein N [Ramlibacter sp.]|uniref:type II secretion system protein N n=1 Tax=Ramlibacter sp. TaxID=1917967 RepID=UPI002C50C9F8|nr:type II secretion system protein N [Ramlibacter sp.]HWI83337.1 type II secretion system protein N [Ramlibacter sp.]